MSTTSEADRTILTATDLLEKLEAMPPPIVTVQNTPPPTNRDLSATITAYSPQRLEDIGASKVDNTPLQRVEDPAP